MVHSTLSTCMTCPALQTWASRCLFLALEATFPCQHAPCWAHWPPAAADILEDTCTVQVHVHVYVCDSRAFEIRNGNSKCPFYDMFCLWTLPRITVICAKCQVGVFPLLVWKRERKVKRRFLQVTISKRKWGAHLMHIVSLGITIPTVLRWGWLSPHSAGL
jgi:hypothetical protein